MNDVPRREIDISICPFQNGGFDIIFIDIASGEEITFSGTKKLTADELAFCNKLAPSCVYTKYARITPEDQE